MIEQSMRGTLLGVVAAIACVAGPVAAELVDQPIDAQRLLLRVDGTGRARVELVSLDRAVALAAPQASVPSTLEVFSHATGAHVVVPFGPPESGGWKDKPGKRRRAPVVTFQVPPPSRAVEGVERLVHRVGRKLALRGVVPGLPFGAPHGGIGLRLSVGAVRLCALFDPESVRRDQPGLFSAHRAHAASLADCSDAALAGPQATPTTLAPSTSTTTTTSTSTTTTTAPADLVIGNDVEFPEASDHSPGYLVGTRIDVPMDAVLTHFGVIGKAAGPRMRLGLYRDVGDEPTTLVVGTPEEDLVAGRMEVAVAPTPVVAGSYWLMAVYDQPASVGIDESDPGITVKFAEIFSGTDLPPLLFFSETFFGQQYNYYVRLVP